MYGNSFHSTLLAVMVPDVPAAEAWGEAHDLNTLECIAAALDIKKEMVEQLADSSEGSFKELREKQENVSVCEIYV